MFKIVSIVTCGATLATAFASTKTIASCPAGQSRCDKAALAAGSNCVLGHCVGDTAPPSTPATPATSANGCCYSIGYGDMMVPCCLITDVTETKTKCDSKKMGFGGASGWAATCPSSASEAHSMLSPTKSGDIAPPSTPATPATSANGCCYSIGYGDMMVPCCLITDVTETKTKCDSKKMGLGGASGWAATCPSSASEAHSMLSPTKSGDIAPPSTPATPATSANGCCYSIGYGDMMKPCCLKTDVTENKTKCDSKKMGFGGASGWAATCPSSAAEAHSMLSPTKPSSV